MEARDRADEIGSPLQGGAPCQLCLFQILDGGKMPVDQRRVGQRPQMLCGLESGENAGRKSKWTCSGTRSFTLACHPARSSTSTICLLGPLPRHGQRRRVRWQRAPDSHWWRDGNGAARCGVDKADEVPPVVAMLDRHNGPLFVKTPDLLQNRLEPYAVLIHGPQFHLRRWEGGSYRLDERADLFLKASCATESAFTCRGRGLRRLPSKRTR